MLNLPTIPEWVNDAICSQTDPETYFPTKSDYMAAVRAKRVCAECPVRSDCLSAALADPNLDGVWGGTTPMERRAIRLGRAG